jgi:hypothetical protein
VAYVLFVGNTGASTTQSLGKDQLIKSTIIIAILALTTFHGVFVITEKL